MAVRVAPIMKSDLRRVAEFLHAHLNSRVSVAAWERSVDVRWTVDAPNHGFMLVDTERDDALAGVYLAFYSERMLDGRLERFCNLGAWCVLPDHRMHGVRLLKALLDQPDLHFTDLSPSGNVIPINTRLKFRFLDTTTALMPNLPWPSRPGRYRVSTDPRVVESTLTGRELQLYRDHADTAAARHLVLLSGDEWCYVVFRRDRRRGLPLFASILHVSDPELFRRMARPLARHLLLRHRIPVSLLETRVTGHRPWPSVLLRSPRRKMFRSARLRPDQIDYLYSELVCVAW
ncbi:hypothetical protein GA0070609_3530 [Micromonospora echinaurantiaca]|uniref:N-acetyltransferase domain-containing protein n=1 Tax=Micromonospora echinaurantiaca TaxID=47857 RepID=A0A1C5ILW2_9ACTN|nr:hypothetical protein [Micromonospora echinaurantiaca]SCG59295.1 hypothetical protein GA0070609_3530 [Micromonospora echinaurantiaca]